MGNPNWGKLYRQGRCKAIGVPWNEDEAEARVLGIPANYVRSGIVTLEAYENAKKEDAENGVPIERLEGEELLAKAKELGLEVSNRAMDDNIRVDIFRALLKKEQEAKKAPKKPKEQPKEEPKGEPEEELKQEPEKEPKREPEKETKKVVPKTKK